MELIQPGRVSHPETTAAPRRLLLVDPYPRNNPYHLTAAERRAVWFPKLSLPTIAAYTPEHWDIDLVDEAVQDIDFDHPAEMVGLSIMTCYAPRAYEIAAEFRKRGKTVVMSGVHPTYCPEEALRHYDAIVCGEAEDLWPELVADYEAGRMKREYRMTSFPSLDNYKSPLVELLSPDAYMTRQCSFTTRGCHFDCEFSIVSPFNGKTTRRRPVQEVVRDLVRVKQWVAIDATVLASLPDAFRAGAERLRISIRAREAISFRRADSTPYGLAIDLGTTTIAGYLIDLENGTLLSARALMNPQHVFGEDVMSRIACVLENADRKLRRAAVDGINTLITALCGEPERIVELTLVGNTAMHHIFLGLPVGQLGRAPYQPRVREAIDCKSRDLGLAVAPGAYVHLPSPVAGFVGSDHVAVILAAGIHTTEKTVLAPDIGTNTEAALAHRGRIKSLSCASGPALEGGHITHGTWAIPGAIDRVSISTAGVSFRTIGDTPPHGLCGSGILDAIAGLVRLGSD